MNENTFERTDLDWDIEDARYEMLGSGAERRQREQRRDARKFYVQTLMHNIQHEIINSKPVIRHNPFKKP